MSEQKAPLLSICVPTYNRSRLLKASLLSILEQLDGHEDEVEVIVSDNCSTDETEEVVRSLLERWNFRYNRNSENIGGGPNYYLLSNKLARGEYCWLIGDDDFLRKDSLGRLLELMKGNPDVDMFFINAQHIEVSTLDGMEEPVSSRRFPDDLRTDSKDRVNRVLSSFDELIDPAKTTSFLTALMCSIFRRSIWMEHSSDVHVARDDFRDVYSTYPHAIILAKGMRGHPVYWIGEPVLVVGDGVRYWNHDFPMVAQIRYLDLLDTYEALGVDPERIDVCRRFVILHNVARIFYMSIRHGGKFRHYVDYNEVISKYVLYKEFWLSFPATMMDIALGKVRRRTGGP